MGLVGNWLLFPDLGGRPCVHRSVVGVQKFLEAGDEVHIPKAKGSAISELKE